MNRKRVLSGIAVLIALSLFVTPGRAESKRPDTIVDLKELLPSAILDIRYQGPHNFVGTPVDGYRAPKCLITREAAEALGKVQAELREFSLSLKIYDCYRPQRAVDHFVRWAQDIGDRKTQKEFYPTVDKRHLFRDGYIAEKSSHTRGSTVDLTIVPVPAPPQEGYTPGQPLKACFLPAAKRFRDTALPITTRNGGISRSGTSPIPTPISIFPWSERPNRPRRKRSLARLHAGGKSSLAGSRFPQQKKAELSPDIWYGVRRRSAGRPPRKAYRRAFRTDTTVPQSEQ
ncbi:MAG: D-alanyl-D-alanine dipeptidase [Deltaproteobacteria bacterium]|nr:D-alanyl-D-alanine dipeptidase [Deltaproteobacteria bacterium]